MSKSTRLSNIELLRIVAMFLVLVVHADFFSLGIPTSNDMTNYPLSSFMRFFFESISICAVDIFVLISGWFGIKSNVKGFFCFVFQILFFLILLHIVFLLKGDIHFNKKNNLSCFVLLSDKHWFIKSYIVLYILSPILNIFTEKASQKQFLFIIANYFIFQTIYGWITNAATFFSDGYSPLHFVGLLFLL